MKFKTSMTLAVLAGAALGTIQFCLQAKADPGDYILLGPAPRDTPIVTTNKIESMSARLEQAHRAATTNSLIVGKDTRGPASTIKPGSWTATAWVPRPFIWEAQEYIRSQGGEWTSETDFWLDEENRAILLCGIPVGAVSIVGNIALLENEPTPMVYIEGEPSGLGKWRVGTRGPDIELNDYAVVLGNAAQGLEYGTTAVGHGAEALQHHATAIGRGALAAQAGSVAVGGVVAYNSKTSYGSVAVGAESFVTNATKGVAVGYRARVKENNAVALGPHTTATDKNAVAIGSVATASAKGAVQIGEGVNAAENTLQFREYRLLDEFGKIPSERLGYMWRGTNDTVIWAVEFGGRRYYLVLQPAL